MIFQRFLLFFASLLLAGPPLAQAHADPRAKCGAEPETPVVSASDVAHYNESVDRFRAYEKSARAFNACVASEAQREEQAISEDARARITKIHAVSTGVQQHIAANFTHLSSELIAAGKKLGHH